MQFYFTWPNIIIFLSVIVYFIYDHFDSKQIKDEREEFIRLKTFEFVQKTTTISLLILSAAYLFTPSIDGLFVIFILILSALYSEIAAKIFYRRKY